MERNRIGFVLRRTLGRLLDNSVLRQYVVYWTDLAELAQAAAPDTRIRWATGADEAALTRFGVDCHLAHDALKSGGRIAVLEDGGRVVAVNLFWIDPVSIDVLSVRCPTGAVMGSNGFVDPAYRGLRFFAAMKAFAAREFLARGYRGMVNLARWHNVSANRGHRHARARPLFRIAILRAPFRLRVVKERNGLSIGRWSKANPKLIVIP